MAQSELFQVNTGSMADVLGQRQYLNRKGFEEIPCRFQVLFILRALEEFQVGLQRDRPLIRTFEETGGLEIPSLNPDQYVRVKKRPSQSFPYT